MGNLKEIREKNGMTQKFVASKAGISISHYSMIESEDRRPSASVAQKIATVLGFPEEWYKLLENTEVSI